jgi:transposase
MARRIVAKASILILERFDLARAARIDSIDSPLHATARHQRVLAAVHVLRQWIINYATKYNVPVRWHKGVSTWICSECANHLNPRDPLPLIQECAHCGHVFDQDVEACRNVLAVHAGSAKVATRSPAVLARALSGEIHDGAT